MPINFYEEVQASNFYKKVPIREALYAEFVCPATEAYSPFWIDRHCLMYCTGGFKIFSTQAREFEVRPGTLLFTKKGAYTTKNFPDNAFTTLLFFLPDAFFRGFFSRYLHLQNRLKQPRRTPLEGILALEMEPALETYFHSIIHYLHNGAITDSKLLELKLDELFLHIFIQPQHRRLAAYLATLSANAHYKVRQVVEENFASNLKLEDYARLCNTSLSSFKRQFLKIYGEAPGKWLLNRRMDLAGRLLRCTQENVNDIAYHCGFESPSHFIRVFKQHFGQTPGRYREEARRANG